VLLRECDRLGELRRVALHVNAGERVVDDRLEPGGLERGRDARPRRRIRRTEIDDRDAFAWRREGDARREED
jgi:hypothetical protein